jgi:hypothetical protein
MFRNIVVVAFQSTFHLKIHQKNIFFYFLKIIFDINALKQSKNTKTILILNKKNSKFLETQVGPCTKTVSSSDSPQLNLAPLH